MAKNYIIFYFILYIISKLDESAQSNSRNTLKALKR